MAWAVCTLLLAGALVLTTGARAQTAPVDPAALPGRIPAASSQPAPLGPKRFTQDTRDTAALTRQRADMRFDRCPPATETEPSKCIVLDASKSVDPLADPVTFRWQMGDGQTREGVQLEYCYARIGRYVVRLDVLDARTGEVRQREDEFIVELSAAAGDLLFEAPATARIGETVTFKLVDKRLPACLSPGIRLNWDFRDGLMAQGRTVQHSFRKAGTFAVRLSVDGTRLDAQCLPRQCVTRDIVVSP